MAARVERVVAMRAEGKTWREIGEVFGRSPGTVYRWMNGEAPERRAQVRTAVAKLYDANRAKGLCKCGAARAHRRKSCERCLARSREFSNRPERRQAHRAYLQRLRQAALAAYGGACACCGVTEQHFLTIDHVDRNGGAHRRLLGNKRIELWLAEHGYPEGFRLLCWNCNLGRERNGGVCPHESQNAEVIQLRAV